MIYQSMEKRNIVNSQLISLVFKVITICQSDYIDKNTFTVLVSDSTSEDDIKQESAEDGLDLNSVRFCSTHKPGKMVGTCKSCSVALEIISDSRIVSKLFDEPSTSGLKSRYGGRCDDVIPTMSLSDEVSPTLTAWTWMRKVGSFSSMRVFQKKM